MSADLPELIGQVVGNWRLSAFLGRGAYASVFSAEHLLIADKRAAVKVLHRAHSADPAIRERFANEARAISRVHHPHIIDIYDVHLGSDGLCCVIMELLDGVTLRQRMAQGPTPTDEVLRLGGQIARGLACAHQARVVHRDLKPENIFMLPPVAEQQTRVKVLDFGVAKLTGPDDPRQTQGPAWHGTPVYMSPEQWNMHPEVDGRADIYALGVLLFEWLTGAPPFAGATVHAVATAHLQDPVPEPPALLALPGARTLIRQMLDKDPERRPQTMVEVAERLEALVQCTASVRLHRRWGWRTAWAMGGLGAGVLLSLLVIPKCGPIPPPPPDMGPAPPDTGPAPPRLRLGPPVSWRDYLEFDQKARRRIPDNLVNLAPQKEAELYCRHRGGRLPTERELMEELVVAEAEVVELDAAADVPANMAPDMKSLAWWTSDSGPYRKKPGRKGGIALGGFTLGKAGMPVFTVPLNTRIWVERGQAKSFIGIRCMLPTQGP